MMVQKEKDKEMGELKNQVAQLMKINAAGPAIVLRDPSPQEDISYMKRQLEEL